MSSQPRPVAGTGNRFIPPNKKTYQQDPANYREALREAELDEAEGADIMMVRFEMLLPEHKLAALHYALSITCPWLPSHVHDFTPKVYSFRPKPKIGVPWSEIRVFDCECFWDDMQPVWLCAGEARHAIPGHHSAFEGQLHATNCRLPCQRYAGHSASLRAPFRTMYDVPDRGMTITICHIIVVTDPLRHPCR